MVNTETTRLQLIQDIISLPEDKLIMVQELVANLAANGEDNGRKKSAVTKKKNRKKTSAKLRKTENPMLALIGCVSYDPPEKSIDEELYGDNPL